MELPEGATVADLVAELRGRGAPFDCLPAEPAVAVNRAYALPSELLGTGDEVVYTLVGEDEADISIGLLSISSPVARALLGKEVDDSVTVRVPAGTREYEVRQIRFED